MLNQPTLNYLNWDIQMHAHTLILEKKKRASTEKSKQTSHV